MQIFQKTEIDSWCYWTVWLSNTFKYELTRNLATWRPYGGQAFQSHGSGKEQWPETPGFLMTERWEGNNRQDKWKAMRQRLKETVRKVGSKGYKQSYVDTKKTKVDLEIVFDVGFEGSNFIDDKQSGGQQRGHSFDSSAEKHRQGQ